jgi:enoyl-CoA hydratase
METSLEMQGRYALLTLNRPAALNALSFDLLRQLGTLFDEVARSEARALIIAGAGEKAFCAGADIKELMGRSLADQQAGTQMGQQVFAKLDGLPIPSIALIGGYAFGGGLELAMACTFRVAVPTAKLGLPEIKLGLIPGYGGTQRLPRLIGESRALELILTGRTVTAAEALQIGLINRLIEPPALEAAMSFAAELTQYGALALQFAHDAVRRGGSATLQEGLKIERDLSTLAFQTEDAAEGMQAFAEKRKPTFRDR